MSTVQRAQPAPTSSRLVSSTTGFDLVAFALALAAGDLGHQVGCYADDAEVRVVDDQRPTVAPLVVTGREAVATWLATSAGLDVDHGVEREVMHLLDGGDRIAFTLSWRDAHGTATSLTSTAELVNGQISVQHSLRTRRIAHGALTSATRHLAG